MKHSPGFLELVDDAKSRVEEVSAEEVVRRLDAGEPVILVDVREESEWAAGHARDAVHLSKGIIERDIEQRFPDKQQALVLYCGGGYRSALAADALRRMGYVRPLSMAGGWKAWNEARGPVER